MLFLLAALFAVYLVPIRDAFHEESCTKRQCRKDLNLKCINKTCLCEPGYIYIDKCVLKKGYMEQCLTLTKYCQDNKNLVCRDGVCECNETSFWNGSKCFSQSTIQQNCGKSEECLTFKELICDTASNKCVCDTYLR